MNTSVNESHRLFSRVPFNAAVTLHLAQQTVVGKLLDVAFKGALLRVDQPVDLTLQEPCRLLLPLTNGSEVIEMTGSIAHLEGRNIGFRCEHIELASLTLLRRLLELNTGDADLMDRELSQLFAPR